MVPDLVLLDLMLPELNGYEVCSILKNEERTRYIPIIMVTAKGTEADIVRGLESGADDYIAKPFSPRVLVARVGAVLRRVPRGAGMAPSPLRVRDILIHPGRHEVMLDQETVELTPSEFTLLEFLARRPGWVFTRTQILDALRGVGYPATGRAVDVVVVGLRKKLGRRGSYIETIRGVGYRFKE
jgi:two-component system phosphate regulon response regulator PhoB